MTTLQMIAAAQAMPLTHRVTTRYADGSEKHHDCRSAAAAENWATGERRKVGRDLTDRTTGATMRAVSVEISPRS